MEWTIKAFDALSAKELYQILQLRINVFMLEQNCLYPECDDKDFHGKHLFAYQDNKVIAYARLLPPGISYSESSIGRVIVHPEYRKLQLGYTLMEKAKDCLLEDFPSHHIRISAQAHLSSFYNNLGFQIESDIYLEDDIPHVEMAYYHIKKEE